MRNWRFPYVVSYHAFRQIGIRTIHGLLAPSHIPSLCTALPFPISQTLSHLDQSLCMAFAQLTYRESLRDIETCLRAHQAKLYHLGIRGNIAKSTLSDANEQRDCRIYMDFAMSLIQIARKLYASDSLAVALEQTVYALDTTTIDLCLSGRAFVRPKLSSRCIHCLIYAAIFQPSSISATARCTKSMCSIS